MLSTINKWYKKIINLGDEEHFDAFDRTNNSLINQIQFLICAWTAFFLVKDFIDQNPDCLITSIILIVLLSFFLIRKKISYLAASAFQISICILSISLEYYIHATELRVEPLYVVVLLLAALLLPTLWSKMFFIVVTIASYFIVEYLVANFDLVFQSGLSPEDNILMFVFASIMVVLITLRYFQLIKKLLKEQSSLLKVLKSKNKELERFAYITSHDLKQPLRNIGSFAGLLRRTIDAPNKTEKKLEYLSQIETSAGRMNTLIEEILSFSKIDKTEITKEEIDLNELLTDFLASHSQYIKEKNAEVNIEELPTVIGNKLYLSLLFQNLIENGIKYNSSNQPLININSLKRDNLIKITIEDNGIGISDEFSAAIFEPFKRLHSRRNYEGTGLGLSICKKIVESHDGKIWLENKKNQQGTKFAFTLPLA